MQAENLISNRDSRCEILESPRKLYDNLLLYVYNNLGNEEKDIFTFSFRGDLPSKVLECRNPLTWFCTLEQRERLSCNDINSLVNYLKEASRQDLVSEARYYQARIRVIRFFQKHLEAGTIAGRKIRLDDKFNEKWSTENYNLPKNYLKRCQELFRSTRCGNDVSVNKVRCLFSQGVLLLVKSCRPSSSDGDQSACLKLLYLANLFCEKFKKLLIDDKELLNIEPQPTGKFLARDYRRRGSAQRRRFSVQKQRRKSSIEIQQQTSEVRGYFFAVFSFLVKMCLAILLRLFTRMPGMFKNNEDLSQSPGNDSGLESEISD